MQDLIKAAKSLSDETRLRILNLLLVRECCVCEVMRVLDISQTRASRNLNLLRDAGFLKVRREGLWAYYSIDRSGLSEHFSLLLEAVETGLANNEIASRDRQRLRETPQIQCCSGAPSGKTGFLKKK